MNTKKMFKLFFLLSLGLISISLYATKNSLDSQAAILQDEGIYAMSGIVFPNNGQPYAIDATFVVCPGDGVRCEGEFKTEDFIYKYSGWKTEGRNDIELVDGPED